MGKKKTNKTPELPQESNSELDTLNVAEQVNTDEKIEIETPKPIKKKKKKGPNIIIYLLSIAIYAGMLYHGYKDYQLINSYTFLPEIYLKYFHYGLMGCGIFFGIFALLPVNNLNKILSSILVVALAYGLVQVSIILPSYKVKLERLFTEVPTEGALNINLYVLNDSEIDGAQDLTTKKVGIQTSVDVQYQDYAIAKIKGDFSEEFEIVEYDDIYSLIEAFYNKEVDAILMNESYVTIVQDDDILGGFTEKCKIVYTCMQTQNYEYSSEAVKNITTDPFIVMIGGNDTYSYYNVLNNSGRTDVQLMCVVNPNTYQILLVTIPRDSYMGLWGNPDMMDKLTHATVYSIDCWLTTIEQYMGLDINYFVRINFSSLVNIVNALGGIDIDNPYTFGSTAIRYYNPSTGEETAEYVVFEEGTIHLTGEHALGYVRERHGLSDGDLGRNKHQAIVLKSLVDRLTSYETITHFDELLDAVKGTFMTDLSMDQIYELVGMQIEKMPHWEILQYSITGTFTGATSYAMGVGKGPIFSVCMLDETTVQKAKSYITKMYNNQKISLE